MKLLVFALVLNLALAGLADADDALVRVKRELKAGKAGAVFEARQLKDPSLIPHLKPLTKESYQLRNFSLPEVDTTLAVLEDAETLQTLVCAVHRGHPAIEQLVLDFILPAVGGRYSIELYRQVLSPEHNIGWQQRLAKHRKDIASDSGFDSPQVTAVFHLAQIVPRAPRSYSVRPALTIEAEARFWRDWLNTEGGVTPIPGPTGQRIDYTGRVCGERKYLTGVSRLTSIELTRLGLR